MPNVLVAQAVVSRALYLYEHLLYLRSALTSRLWFEWRAAVTILINVIGGDSQWYKVLSGLKLGL